MTRQAADLRKTPSCQGAGPDANPKIHESAIGKTQVIAPKEVHLPLPKDTLEQIEVPASINGRDLSNGHI